MAGTNNSSFNRFLLDKIRWPFGYRGQDDESSSPYEESHESNNETGDEGDSEANDDSNDRGNEASNYGGNEGSNDESNNRGGDGENDGGYPGDDGGYPGDDGGYPGDDEGYPGDNNGADDRASGRDGDPSDPSESSDSSDPFVADFYEYRLHPQNERAIINDDFFFYSALQWMTQDKVRLLLQTIASKWHLLTAIEAIPMSMLPKDRHIKVKRGVECQVRYPNTKLEAFDKEGASPSDMRNWHPRLLFQLMRLAQTYPGRDGFNSARDLFEKSLANRKAHSSKKDFKEFFLVEDVDYAFAGLEEKRTKKARSTPPRDGEENDIEEAVGEDVSNGDLNTGGLDQGGEDAEENAANSAEINDEIWDVPVRHSQEKSAEQRPISRPNSGSIPGSASITKRPSPRIPIPSQNDEISSQADDNQPSDRRASARQPSDRQPSDHQPGSRQPSDHQPSSRRPAERQPSDHQPGSRVPGDNAPPATNAPPAINASPDTSAPPAKRRKRRPKVRPLNPPPIRQSSRLRAKREKDNKESLQRGISPELEIGQEEPNELWRTVEYPEFLPRTVFFDLRSKRKRSWGSKSFKTSVYPYYDGEKRARIVVKGYEGKNKRRKLETKYPVETEDLTDADGEFTMDEEEIDTRLESNDSLDGDMESATDEDSELESVMASLNDLVDTPRGFDARRFIEENINDEEERNELRDEGNVQSDEEIAGDVPALDLFNEEDAHSSATSPSHSSKRVSRTLSPVSASQSFGISRDEAISIGGALRARRTSSSSYASSPRSSKSSHRRDVPGMHSRTPSTSSSTGFPLHLRPFTNSNNFVTDLLRNITLRLSSSSTSSSGRVSKIRSRRRSPNQSANLGDARHNSSSRSYEEPTQALMLPEQQHSETQHSIQREPTPSERLNESVRQWLSESSVGSSVSEDGYQGEIDAFLDKIEDEIENSLEGHHYSEAQRENDERSPDQPERSAPLVEDRNLHPTLPEREHTRRSASNPQTDLDLVSTATAEMVQGEPAASAFRWLRSRLFTFSNTPSMPSSSRSSSAPGTSPRNGDLDFEDAQLVAGQSDYEYPDVGKVTLGNGTGNVIHLPEGPLNISEDMIQHELLAKYPPTPIDVRSEKIKPLRQDSDSGIADVEGTEDMIDEGEQMDVSAAQATEGDDYSHPMCITSESEESETSEVESDHGRNRASGHTISNELTFINTTTNSLPGAAEVTSHSNGTADPRALASPPTTPPYLRSSATKDAPREPPSPSDSSSSSDPSGSLDSTPLVPRISTISSTPPTTIRKHTPADYGNLEDSHQSSPLKRKRNDGGEYAEVRHRDGKRIRSLVLRPGESVIIKARSE